MRYALGVVVVVLIGALVGVALRKPDTGPLEGRLEDIERNIANEEWARERSHADLLRVIHDLERKVERIESR
jgi:hypothetical protein